MTASSEMTPRLTSQSITLRIVLTAVFTALVTVATVILVISLPAAGGFFNLGEAMIYITALLLGPISGGIAGGVGAMLGDLILGFPLYAPATIVIKFLEGLVVGFLFNKLKKGMTDESLRSRKTTIRILQSGFLIGAVVIIVGVNADPADTLFWVIIGSLFICTAFISILLKKVPIYYMIISIIPGGAIMVTGYLLYSTFVLLYPGAYLNLPFDTLQTLIGLVIAVPVYQALLKAGVVQRI
nr:ECF transporter S component [Candidatus Sigynarchaeota archaeon]